jgi:hypothetical protein
MNSSASVNSAFGIVRAFGECCFAVAFDHPQGHGVQMNDSRNSALDGIKQ